MVSSFFTIAAILLLIAGISHALHAILYAKTSKSAIAWAVVLIQFPYITIPLYWIFGRYRFEGYIASRRKGKTALHTVTQHAFQKLAPWKVSFFRFPFKEYLLQEQQIGLPLTRGNDVSILHDGQETFSAIFDAIDQASSYIILEFFIIRADDIGTALKEKLQQKAREHVRVYLLYDKIGSYWLPNSYISDLQETGVNVQEFGAAKWGTPFQINFRNHRKLVIVDGSFASLGGINVGDEYMSKRRRFSPWRDTNIALRGPVVQCLQVAFLEDWYWATGQIPTVNWTPTYSRSASGHVLPVPTGPADKQPLCCFMLLQLFHTARKNLWISTPYFVPDDALSCAIKLAALRGVDVRILLPAKADHKLVYLSSFPYIADMIEAGVKVYRYQPGFIHQKVILVDDVITSIGTVNLDNRSVYLDFELTALTIDKSFAAEARRMLENDLAQCRTVRAEEYTRRSIGFKTAVAVARLLDPIQ